MKELLQNIKNLENKILVSLESLNYYIEFKYLKESLLNKLNSYQYDSHDNLSIKKYYAWLQFFYENVIEVINKKITEFKGNSVFDNSTEEQHDSIKKIKDEISKVLDYMGKNYPQFIKKIKKSYEDLNKYYEDMYNSTLKKSKTMFNKEILQVKGPVLSLYQDAYTLFRFYIVKLECFNASCKEVKKFVEIDLRIRETFKKAYETITQEDILVNIKKIEDNYHKKIESFIDYNFSLEGPEQIQKEMLAYCNHIEDIINKEITKKEYYDKIVAMSLNIDTEELLDIINYVETNGFFKEELYNNLYIIIEKEKYLLVKYNRIPEIYNKLSDNVKAILEKKFISRLSEYTQLEANDIIYRLKKNGYIKTMDLKYQRFFDKHVFKNNQTFDIQELKCHVAMSRHYNEDEEVTIQGSKIIFYDRNNFDMAREYKVGNILCVDECNNDHFYVLSSGKRKLYAIDCKTGRRIKIPNKLGFHLNYELKYFVHKNGTDKSDTYRYDFYNEDFEKVFTIENASELIVDYRCNKFLVCQDQCLINIYNEKLKLEKTINFNNVYKVSRIIIANDGVLTLLVKKDGVNFIVYYDYVNMKEIDSFRTKLNNLEQYVYSEGLYIFRDSNGKYGYKNINGEIALEPIYYKAGPFLGNIADVYIEMYEELILDRTGKHITRKEFIEKLCKVGDEKYRDSFGFPTGAYNYLRYNVEIQSDLKINKYKILDYYNHHYFNKGFIMAFDNYTTDINTSIMSIDFSSEKSKIKSMTL